MSIDIIKQDIESFCRASGLAVDNKGLYEKCALLCEKFSLTAKEITGSLEAFLINANKSSLSLDIMGKFENHILQNSSKRKKIKFMDESPSGPAPNTTKRSMMFGTPEFEGTSSASQYDNDPIVSSQNALTYGSRTPMAVKGTFSQRVDRGKVILSVNESLEDRGSFEPSSMKAYGGRVRISTKFDDDDEVFENVVYRYRYMYTSLEERARAMDKQLFKIQKDMCQLSGIDEEKDLQPIGVPSQDVVWICGRVCNEASEGRINKASVLLEGSRRDSGGRRVKLELKDIESFSLFPGQIVLVQGTASSGRVMVAKRLIEGIPRPLPNTSPAKLLEYHYQNTSFQSGQPLHVIVAAGPYTTNENLFYEPFQALLKYVVGSKPDVVVLTGPFVDVTQPLLETGDVTLDEQDNYNNIIGSHAASYEMVFQEKIVRDGLAQMFNSESEYGTIPTQFIFLPSLNDAHHEYVYPQPPFGDREYIQTEYFKEPIGKLNVPYSDDNDPRKRVHLLSNPCMFQANEVLFGVTSNDVLFGLSSDEASTNIPGSMRLQRLASHLLQQQSFNPHFPPSNGSSAQMDFRQARHWQMHKSPDILILPSKLTAMARDVNGTLVINPGSLVKGSSAGTFAELHIHPMSEDTIRDALIAGKTSIPHQIPSRTKVAIKKI